MNGQLVTQHSTDERRIAWRNGFHTPQVTFPLRRLFGQDVVPEGLTVLIAFRCFLKALGSTTTGFQFWHDRTPHCSC
jgi:hypothetical protein